jgi:multicomponent Na+:H+ antiporter subunit D
VLSFAKFGYYAFVRAPPKPLEIRPSRPALSAVLVVAAVPSVVFGLAPDLLFDALPGGAGGFEPYATSELTKAAAVTLAGTVGFVALRRPLSRVPRVDVDRVLHPAAFRSARSAAALAAGTGRRSAAALAATLAVVASALDREDPTALAESAIGTTVLVVGAGLGVVLLIAQFG